MGGDSLLTLVTDDHAVWTVMEMVLSEITSRDTRPTVGRTRLDFCAFVVNVQDVQSPANSDPHIHQTYVCMYPPKVRRMAMQGKRSD